MGGPKEDMTLLGPILRAHPDFQLTGLGLGNVRIVSFHPPCQELAPGKDRELLLHPFRFIRVK
uniref:Uncharacterized protein n=1 Tax=Anguilla anguilla TaxID=7936 RepID=A0A0E9PZ94_ANGAN